MLNVKKLIYFSIFSSFLISVNNSYANNFYVGAGFQSNKAKYEDQSFIVANGVVTYKGDNILETDFNNVNFFTGYKFDDLNLAFEVGYFNNSDKEKTFNTGLIWLNNGNPVGAKTETSLQIINFDGIYNYNFNDKISALLIGTVAKVDAEIKTSFYDGASVRGSSTYEEDGFGFGGGLGLEAKLHDKFSVRATAKTLQIFGDLDETVKSIFSYNLGVKYNF